MHVQWEEWQRKLVAHRFALHTADGAIVEVHPGARVGLIAPLAATRNQEGDMRERVAQLTEGDSVWIRGTLRPGVAEGAPYRGSDEVHWVLEPEDDAPLVISTRPLGHELRASRGGGWSRPCSRSG